jgi:spore germination protein GerM
MKRYANFWNVLGLLLLLLGLFVYLYSRPGRTSEVVNLPAAEVQPQTPRDVTLRLYFAKDDASGFLIEKRKVTLQPGESIYQRALAEVVAGPRQGAMPIVPKGAPVPTVFVRGNKAYVDLPRDYAALGLGTTGETLLVYGMAYTLIDQGPVEEVHFLVGGEPAVTLGHLSLLEPIRRPR